MPDTTAPAEPPTVRRVYATVERFFSLPPGSVSAATTADDVEAWDSVSHVGLILAIEEEFGIVFDVASVGAFERLGELATETSRLAGPDAGTIEPATPAAAPGPPAVTAGPAEAPAQPSGGLFGFLKRLFGRG